MTRDNYAIIAKALGACSFLPGSWDKRFARSMAFRAEHPEGGCFTERQRVHILRLAHKYRRQIPTSVLELVLDEAERAADRRAAEGNGALADFAKAKRKRRERKAARVVAVVDPDLFGGGGR